MACGQKGQFVKERHFERDRSPAWPWEPGAVLVAPGRFQQRREGIRAPPKRLPRAPTQNDSASGGDSCHLPNRILYIGDSSVEIAPICGVTTSDHLAFHDTRVVI